MQYTMHSEDYTHSWHFLVVRNQQILPISTGLLHWRQSKHIVVPVMVRQSCKIFVKVMYDSTISHDMTTVKQSTTDHVHILWDILYDMWCFYGFLLVTLDCGEVCVLLHWGQVMVPISQNHDNNKKDCHEIAHIALALGQNKCALMWLLTGVAFCVCIRRHIPCMRNLYDKTYAKTEAYVNSRFYTYCFGHIQLIKQMI